MPRTEEFPDLLKAQIENYIETNGSDFLTSKQVKNSILTISDHFQNKVRVTPWDNPYSTEAYFIYFHLLNTIRMKAVFKELARFFPHLAQKQIVDFGSGLGASEIAFQSIFPESQTPWLFVESHRMAKSFHQKIRGPQFTAAAEWSLQLPENLKQSLLIASYSLNEMDQFPRDFFNAETLVILEPSTQSVTRKLMESREILMNKGFQILAPCTHHDKCPLLAHSKKDWCYDRIFWDRPDWFESLETQLPMKNRSLTFSYLIATKQEISREKTHQTRVIGDTLKEKGKTRQMICRGPEREFISWLKRDGKPQDLPHGSLIQLPNDVEKKGIEIRVKENKITIAD